MLKVVLFGEARQPEACRNRVVYEVKTMSSGNGKKKKKVETRPTVVIKLFFFITAGYEGFCSSKVLPHIKYRSALLNCAGQILSTNRSDPIFTNPADKVMLTLVKRHKTTTYYLHC